MFSLRTLSWGWAGEKDASRVMRWLVWPEWNPHQPLEGRGREGVRA